MWLEAVLLNSKTLYNCEYILGSKFLYTHDIGIYQHFLVRGGDKTERRMSLSQKQCQLANL